MANFRERKIREFQLVDNQEQIAHMLHSYVAGKTYYIKGMIGAEVKIESILKGNTLLVITDSLPDEHPIIYRVFKKYMELICELDSDLGNGRYRFKVNAIQIAINERKFSRNFVPEGAAYINGIRAARNIINASLFNIPTSVKVHFDQFERQLAPLADEVFIKVFDKKDDKTELVRKTGKILYIADTQDVLSYAPENEAIFIDYRNHINTDIGKIMDDYRNRKIVSEIIVPITYIGHDGIAIPLGYIHMISRSTPITAETPLDLKTKAFEMVDRIRDSNTMLINKRQSINNASHGGMQLKISDEELKKFLIHQKGFSFDVVFKLQQPITVFTEIVYTGEDIENNLLIGVRIKGWSSRKGEMDRYFDLVDKLTA